MTQFTGERPDDTTMPASLQALHDAGYEQIAARLGSGTLLDVGCGVGSGSAVFLAPGRRVVGVDYSPETAAQAARRFGDAGLRTTCMDGTQLGVADGSVDFVSSLHLIEHFTQPELHVAELARVVADDGTCFVVTPNEPADFENPFHLTLFRPESLERLLRVYFDDVTIEGLDGSAAVKAEFDKRRRFARAVLRVDFMGLRHKLPRRHYVALHALARRLAYPVIHWRQRRDPAPPATAADFHISADIDDTTFVLFATAREPRRGAAAR